MYNTEVTLPEFCLKFCTTFVWSIFKIAYNVRKMPRDFFVLFQIAQENQDD